MSGGSGKGSLRTLLTRRKERELRAQRQGQQTRCLPVLWAMGIKDWWNRSSWEAGHALFCRWRLVEGDTGTIQISGLGINDRSGFFKFPQSLSLPRTPCSLGRSSAILRINLKFIFVVCCAQNHSFEILGTQLTWRLRVPFSPLSGIFIINNTFFGYHVPATVPSSLGLDSNLPRVPSSSSWHLLYRSPPRLSI